MKTFLTQLFVLLAMIFVVASCTRFTTPASETAGAQSVNNQPVIPAFAPTVAENGSYYGELNKYGVPKTVFVHGYFRRDGTYVRSYFRSAPSR